MYPVRINDSSDGGCARVGDDDADDGGDDDDDLDDGAGAVIDADGGAREGDGAGLLVAMVALVAGALVVGPGWSVPNRRRYEEEHYW